MEIQFLALSFAIQHLSFGLLYAGPDQLLPLASILGAIVGILMIGWQRIVGFMRSAFASVMHKVRPSRGK
jgi:hypothetical protein